MDSPALAGIGMVLILVGFILSFVGRV